MAASSAARLDGLFKLRKAYGWFVEKSTHLGNATVEDCRSIYRVLLKARQEIRQIKFSNLGEMSERGLKLFTDASYRKLNTVDSVGGDLVFITGNNRVNILQ